MRESHRLQRGAFTLVEVSLGVALSVVVLLVVFELFLTGRRGTTVLHQSLEANEAVLRTFRMLTRDIRSAQEVLQPPLAARGTPEPEFAWSLATEGTHRIDLELLTLVFEDGSLVPRTQRVLWYLDEPQELAGGGGRTWSLFRRETLYQTAPGGPSPGGPGAAAQPGAGTSPGGPAFPADAPPAKKVAENVHELVFFRRQDDPADPQPDAGPRNVVVRMTSSRIQRTPEGKQIPAYTAELHTTVHLRGGR
jgi:hypothetical protein